MITAHEKHLFILLQSESRRLQPAYRFDKLLNPYAICKWHEVTSDNHISLGAVLENLESPYRSIKGTCRQLAKRISCVVD